MFFTIISFLFIIFAISYFIWWIIYRKILKTKEEISKILVFIGGIGLIIFYYTPYSFYLEPSFWEFKKICKLNDLPNNEEKYNKMLSYFDLSLDTLDWEELNKNALKLRESSSYYIPKQIECAVRVATYKNNAVWFYGNCQDFHLKNLDKTKVKIFGEWYTNRYFLEQEGVASYKYEWNERSITCSMF